MAELFQKHAHPPRMRTHFDHHMGRWASKEEGPKRLANRLDGFRSFDSAVRPKNAQSALLVSQIASNHRSGTFRHGRSLLAPSSALKPADYLLGLKERPPHPISVGRAACVAQNPYLTSPSRTFTARAPISHSRRMRPSLAPLSHPSRAASWPCPTSADSIIASSAARRRRGAQDPAVTSGRDSEARSVLAPWTSGLTAAVAAPGDVQERPSSAAPSGQ